MMETAKKCSLKFSPQIQGIHLCSVLIESCALDLSNTNGHDRMVVGFINTYAISAYLH